MKIGLLLPLANILVWLVRTDSRSQACACDLWVAGWLIVVAVAEEIFFRGFLLSEFQKYISWSRIKSAVSVSFLFAILHLCNLWSGTGLSYVLVQSFFAFGASVILCWIYCTQWGLISCMVIHGLVNLTSLLLEGKMTLTLADVLIYVATALICTYCGLKRLGNLEV